MVTAMRSRGGGATSALDSGGGVTSGEYATLLRGVWRVSPVAARGGLSAMNRASHAVLTLSSNINLFEVLNRRPFGFWKRFAGVGHRILHYAFVLAGLRYTIQSEQPVTRIAWLAESLLHFPYFFAMASACSVAFAF